MIASARLAWKSFSKALRSEVEFSSANAIFASIIERNHSTDSLVGAQFGILEYKWVFAM